MVNITDDTDLSPLAKITRQLNGRVQGFNHNAEVFLSDTEFKYIGRICHWKDCRPGIRMSCDALHCGKRKYLHDDLNTIALSKELIMKPPVELWPKIIRRVTVPLDVEEILLSKLTPFA